MVPGPGDLQHPPHRGTGDYRHLGPGGSVYQAAEAGQVHELHLAQVEVNPEVGRVESGLEAVDRGDVDLPPRPNSPFRGGVIPAHLELWTGWVL